MARSLMPLASIDGNRRSCSPTVIAGPAGPPAIGVARDHRNSKHITSASSKGLLCTRIRSGLRLGGVERETAQRGRVDPAHGAAVLAGQAARLVADPLALLRLRASREGRLSF